MEFTGERYMPTESGKIRLEHYHRYSIVLDVIRNKKVLDVACGEGYGSYFIAGDALSVTGVDISSEAVNHASKKYKKTNLKYTNGSASRLDFADEEFDVVISFETIEHLYEQSEMVEEIRRVLNKDGLFIISSPNRPVYSEESSELNEFHVKELDFAELDHLLRGRFDAVQYYGQRLQIASIVQPFFELCNNSTVSTDAGGVINRGAAELKSPVYFIAVCACKDVKLPNLGMSAFYPADIDLIAHYVGHAKWAKKVAEDVVIRDAQINDLNKKIENQNHKFSKTDGESEVISDNKLMMSVPKKNLVDQKTKSLEDEVQLLKKKINDIHLSKSWALTRPLRIVARLYRYGITQNEINRTVELLKPYWHRLPVQQSFKKRISDFVRRKLSQKRQTQSARSVPAESSVFIAPVQLNSADYMIFGVIDWYFRHQRPQQLALQISEMDRRAFYISVDFVDSDTPGFSVESLGVEGRLFNVHLHLKGAPSIYGKPPTENQLMQLRQSMGRLLDWTHTISVVSLVQHPFWSQLAAQLPNSRLVYDCMDHHEGFGGVSAEMIAQERALLSAADLTVTTSLWLDNQVSTKTKRHVLIRNATEFEHFSTLPQDIYKDPHGRQIIGYYGAIAEWFDVDLMVAIAKAFPECAIVLLGADTVGAQRRLAGLKNVIFLGEIPYKELPRFAHAFDVCLLPFKVIPLTLATNPVKVYEYLSMGKPVVSTDLPEVREMGSVCAVADDAISFVNLVRERLEKPGDFEGRQAFARQQTWTHRAKELIQASESSAQDPLVSVVVVTYNNLALTKECLASIDRYSDYANIEVIVVDNASSDGSQDWLQEWSVANGRNRKLILNTDNRGFATGNNQGLSVASGEYLVMLNNDTHVTPGWVRTMVNHMKRDPNLGLLGPVTNNIGNEARIDVFYDDMNQMLERSARYTREHLGQVHSISTAAFFCVMLKRSVFEKIGPLDEVFGRGFFEDDDYCRRLEKANLKIAYAEDVFVHHQLSASFNKLKSEDRKKLFENNKKIYEAKWGQWVPHKYRPPSE